MQLRTLGRFAITIMLDKSEGLDQPVNRPGDILVGQMGKDYVGRNGTISQHSHKILRAAKGINRVVNLF